MNIKTALNLAELWGAGKMIGGDEDAVISSLLAELKTVDDILKHATDVIDELTYEHNDRFVTVFDSEHDVDDKVRFVTTETDKIYTNRLKT